MRRDEIRWWWRWWFWDCATYVWTLWTTTLWCVMLLSHYHQVNSDITLWLQVRWHLFADTGVARILSAVHFFAQRSWGPFCSRRLHKLLSEALNLRCTAKKCPKNWLLLCLGVHLQIFPVNYVSKFFLRPGCTHCTVWLRWYNSKWQWPIRLSHVCIASRFAGLEYLKTRPWESISDL